MKKTITLFALVAVFVISGFSQESEKESYKLYRMVYITPEYDKLTELGEAMAKHNKEFHNEGPHRASVWLAKTGPHTGEWCLVMGPSTYTDLDSPITSEEHKEDWLENVMPYIKKMSDGEYWKRDDKHSYIKDDAFSGKEIWTMYDIKPFEGYRFNELLKKVVEVYKEKDYPNYMEVYRSQFRSDNGRDIAIAFGFKNWAFFDEEDKFWKDYEEVHGEGARWKFFEEYREVVISSYEEVSIFVPELSGGQE